jgi:hypothetical protein
MFQPDPEGWTVGYIRGMGGGELVTCFDLGDTGRAAVRTLLELSAALRGEPAGPRRAPKRGSLLAQQTFGRC